MLTTTRIRPEFGNCSDLAISGMEGGELQERKLGSVKAVITSYWKQILEDYPANKKLEPNYSKKPDTETRELLDAKKKVKDLTRRIEESNSRAKAMTARRSEEEWRRIEEVMKEAESVKREITKLKLHTASVLAEKRRAEKEMNLAMSNSLSYSSSVEGLNKEIELIDEEHVLVEVAKIEARKEFGEIEAQRREDAGKHSVIVEEMHKKKQAMIQQIEDVKDLETKLEVTKSEIDRLESRLKQVKLNSNFHKNDESGSATLLESLTREIEAAKKEMASIEVERFEFKSSIDVIRDKLSLVSDKADALKKKEREEDTAIQNLNSQLTIAKAKLEASSAGAKEAKSTASNLSTALERIESESRKSEKEQAIIGEETALVKTQVQKTKSEMESAEERLRGAWKNLEAVKSSEAIALENLKAVIQNTVRRRALSSQNCTTITISKFEYDYLKGNAAEAGRIAEKKVEAAQAWVEALKASEKQIQMKSKEGEVSKTEGSTTGRRAKGRKSASFTLRRRK